MAPVCIKRPRILVFLVSSSAVVMELFLVPDTDYTTQPENLPVELGYIREDFNL
ncbi:hypothetical protein SLEP1_g52377 [Rubroshorea leprosula]|uniref:Uncharacterized protein n=1 Tax=Rubroshorea leprosula TaxID=152421 RepID=A0AAV5M7T7_9ROSI|nr:hypothetical protein SLEP1_g52377 [Rubroshorea leprosula]